MISSSAADDRPPAKRVGNISSYPVEEQHALILDDFFYLLLGLNGSYSRLQSSETEKYSVALDSTLDVTLRDMALGAIPVCLMYQELQDFVATYLKPQYGLMNHALCAGIRALLKDYTTFVSQLELQARAGKLSLSGLCADLEPTHHMLAKIVAVARHIQTHKLKGAGGFNYLHQCYHMQLGDEESCKLFFFLMESMALPYLEMLSSWIYTGTLHDPYDEFVVKENKDLRKETLIDDFNDTYWEQRFIIRREQLLLLFEGDDLAEKILTTGKYVNALRECGEDLRGFVKEPFVFSLNPQESVQRVDKVLQQASQVLLRKLLHDEQLLLRLRGVKRYLLLEQGDFFVQLLDTADAELAKAADEISLTKLSSLLELALKTTNDADPFKEAISCRLLPYNLIQQLMRILHVSTQGAVNISAIGAASPARSRGGLLTGFEAFALDYRVKWPLSLVLSRKALTKYQLIYRHLFRYIERQLCNVWVSQQTLKDYELRSLLIPSHHLRQKMLQFVQNLEAYLMFEVVDKNWVLFQERLRAVTTVDELLKLHGDFLDTCLKGCMLTDAKLVKIVTQLMSLCQYFCEYSDRHVKVLRSDAKVKATRLRGSVVKARQAARLLPRDDAFLASLNNFEQNFQSNLRLLLDTLRASEYDQQLFYFSERLDLNDFYARSAASPARAATRPGSVLEP